MPSKTASPIRDELNLDPVTTEPNVEQGVVDQAVMVKDQLNVRLLKVRSLTPKNPKRIWIGKDPDIARCQ